MTHERATAGVNLAAIGRNVERAKARAGPEVAICAVVKGDGYGHGAAPVASAALAAGATRLAVSTAAEAADLRRAGIVAPILVMGPLSEAELELAVASRAEVVAWHRELVEQLTRRDAGTGTTGVHLHVDVGMGNVGLRDVGQARALASEITAKSGVTVAGVMTQLPDAGDPDDPSLEDRLRRFSELAGALREIEPGLIAHAENSPVLIRSPRARFDMVRVGDLLYGFDPFGADPAPHHLEPALTLTSRVASIRRLRPGDTAGYGGRFAAETATRIAVVPVGYGDGLRRCTRGAHVLVGGRRRAVVGAVAMDSLMVDLGDDGSARIGDPVVLIGRQGAERITAEELAGTMGAVNAELTCGLTARVRRVYHRDGERSA